MTVDPHNDTIAAIATPPGEGAIAIVRVSGPSALAVADRVFDGGTRRPSRCGGGQFLYGRIRAPGHHDGTLIDEAVLLVFRTPRSYTREDVVEFQGHGGRAAAGRMLQAVLDAGARLAEPGEFTRRAFLHGRLDLLQAEAVAGLIQAKSERAATAAMEQLNGKPSADIHALYDAIVTVTADVEASLDFDDLELGDTLDASVAERLSRARCQTDALLTAAREGRLLRDGASVAIAGRPNVGKSTLLNTLLGHARAIVSSTPGTTRDTIEETMVLAGVPLRLVDTAGLRQADCELEREGIGRARAQLKHAHLVLYMLDARGLHADDRAMLDDLPPAQSVIVVNKTDLGCQVTPSATHPHTPIFVCLHQGQGLDTLRGALLDRLGLQAGGDLHSLATERHRRGLQTARDELDAALRLLARDGLNENSVLIAQHAREAMAALACLTGRNSNEEILDAIFSRFCIGK